MLYEEWEERNVVIAAVCDTDGKRYELVAFAILLEKIENFHSGHNLE